MNQYLMGLALTQLISGLLTNESKSDAKKSPFTFTSSYTEFLVEKAQIYFFEIGITTLCVIFIFDADLNRIKH